MHKELDLDEAMYGIVSANHAYIVGDYLIIYDIGSPWYSSKVYLFELLVLNLSTTRSDFSVVTEFLERSAREAGAAAVATGTALARSDRALASLYIGQGYQSEAVTLTKEL